MIETNPLTVPESLPGSANEADAYVGSGTEPGDAVGRATETSLFDDEQRDPAIHAAFALVFRKLDEVDFTDARWHYPKPASPCWTDAPQIVIR